MNYYGKELPLFSVDTHTPFTYSLAFMKGSPIVYFTLAYQLFGA